MLGDKKSKAVQRATDVWRKLFTFSQYHQVTIWASYVNETQRNDARWAMEQKMFANSQGDTLFPGPEPYPKGSFDNPFRPDNKRVLTVRIVTYRPLT